MLFYLVLIGGFIYYNPLAFMEFVYSANEFINSKKINSVKSNNKHNIVEFNVADQNKVVYGALNTPNIFSSATLKVDNNEIECTDFLNKLVIPNLIVDLSNYVNLICEKNNLENENNNYEWDIITNKAVFLSGRNLVLHIDNKFNISTI